MCMKRGGVGLRRQRPVNHRLVAFSGVPYVVPTVSVRHGRKRGGQNLWSDDQACAPWITTSSVRAELGQKKKPGVATRLGVETALEKTCARNSPVVLASIPACRKWTVARRAAADSRSIPRFEKTPTQSSSPACTGADLDRLKGATKIGAVDYVSITGGARDSSPQQSRPCRSKLYCKRRELREPERKSRARPTERPGRGQHDAQARRTRELKAFNATLQGANTGARKTRETGKPCRERGGFGAERARRNRGVEGKADRPTRDEFLGDARARAECNRMAPISVRVQLMRPEAQARPTAEPLERRDRAASSRNLTAPASTT